MPRAISKSSWASCPDYPCEIVLKGETKPGDDCLDVARVVAGYRAIIDAIKNKEFEGFNDLGAHTLSNAFHVVNMLLDDIVRDGTMAKRSKYDGSCSCLCLLDLGRQDLIEEQGDIRPALQTYEV